MCCKIVGLEKDVSRLELPVPGDRWGGETISGEKTKGGFRVKEVCPGLNTAIPVLFHISSCFYL